MYRADYHSDSQLDSLYEAVTKLSGLNDKTIIFGDFNMPDVC